MKKLTKKFMAFFLIILILSSFLPLQTFAVFITDLNSNATFGVINNSYATYGHELHYATYDGVTYILFCMQKGVTSPTGITYQYGSDFEKIVNDATYKQIAQMIYFGYTSIYGYGLPSSTEAKKAACCTQEYVWEVLGYGNFRSTWNSNYMSESIYSNWLEIATSRYNQYYEDVSFNNITQILNYGSNIIYDSNDVLQNYETFTEEKDGITFSHVQGNNYLEINVPDSYSSTSTITFSSQDYNIYKLNLDGSIYDSAKMAGYVYFKFASGSVQNLMFSNYIEPSSFNISVKVESGELTLIKSDSETGNNDRIDGTSHHGDATIDGAVYTLYASEDIYKANNSEIYFSKDEAIANFVFNEYGVADVEILKGDNLWVNESTLKGLPYGNYYAKETVAPSGYNMDKNIYEYCINDNNTNVISNVTNTVEKAKFEVIKISSNKSEIAKVVDGAEFTAILTKYVDYYGSFEEALKHLDEYAEDEYSIFTTGSDGHGVSGYLAYGNYTINETVTPEGVNTVEEFYVTINANSNGVIKELVANDVPFEAYIKLIKIDKDTGKSITYSNATFSLYKLNENTSEWEKVYCKVGETIYSTWTTNSEGYAVTENKLESGTYKIDEVTVPTGFTKIEGEIIFEVNNKNESLEYDKDYDAWITVTIENEQPTGSLQLTKIINLDDNADKSLIESIDFTQIYFKLVAKEDIIDYADGSVIFEEGEEIGTYNLDEKGKLTISDISLGNYFIQEVATIDGLVLDETKYDVIVKQEDTKTVEYKLYLEVENKATLIEISKTDITGEKELEGAKLQVLDLDGNVIDEWISEKSTHKIEGLVVGSTYILHEEVAVEGYVKATDIEFTVSNTEEKQLVTMIDKLVGVVKIDSETGNILMGAVLKIVDKNGEVIDTWTTTDEIHYVSGLIEGETYTLIEEKAPSGYETADDVEFTVSLNKSTQIVKMKDTLITIEEEVIQTGKTNNANMYFDFMLISLVGIVYGLNFIKKK